jgi:NAD-dependent deacetylase
MANDDAIAAAARTAAALASGGRLVVVTGAGLSADSGIPTFRGEEGYWRVGSRNYHPTELATAAAFRRVPEVVWPWYLYRRGVCRAAEPNAAHRALAALGEALGERMTLLTQNVDGLHLRAGHCAARIYEIHGNINYARCAASCTPSLYSLDTFDDATAARLHCPRCGDRLRPHVLWFDETYDERHFRWDSSLRAAGEAAALWVVGSSGSTNLPNLVAQVVASAGGLVVDVNPDDSPFAALARHTGGAHVRQGALQALPTMVREVIGRQSRL